MGTNMSETMGANIKANTKININNTKFYLRGCALYSVFYVLCLYHNPSGITFPLFAAGNIVLFRLFAAKRTGCNFAMPFRANAFSTKPQLCFLAYPHVLPTVQQ